MPLPRLQLFEFNDAAWAPKALRDTLIDALTRTVEWGHLVDGLVEPFAALLERAGTHEVLDLCAGGGAPASLLSKALAQAGRPAHFLLSDLFPHPAEWQALAAQQPGRLDFVTAPVDATAIPAELGPGRVRAIINAFHHFPPPLAREVLRGACRDAPGVFIAEGLVRNPLSFAALAPAGLAGLVASPALAKDQRVARALLTWLTPLALGAAIWDGTVSALRVYEADELEAMVADLAGWTWAHGTYRHSNGLGRGSWFAGVRG